MLTLLGVVSLSPPAPAQQTLWDEAGAGQGRTMEQGRSAQWALEQHRKMSAAMAAIRPQQKGVTDAFVLVIGLDSDPVFGRESAETAKVLSRRYGAIGRTLLLSAGDGAGAAAMAHGSPDHLALAIASIAARMDKAEDVLILYLTAHGSRSLGLAYRDGDKGFGFIGAERLAGLLNESGIKNRLVMVSACYSGIFIPSLQNETSIILTAASDQRPSFGCNPGNDWTFFGDALINTALRKPAPLQKAVVEAYSLIGDWERGHGLDASSPQSLFGLKSAGWLAALEKRVPQIASAKTGRPAIAVLTPLVAPIEASR